MKRNIAILIGLLLVLLGCSSNNITYSRKELINEGFYPDSSYNYIHQVAETGYVKVDLDESQLETDSDTFTTELNVIMISGGVCESNNKCVELIYTNEIGKKDKWYANILVGSTSQKIEPKDAYAYINLMEPQVISEFNKLVENQNINTRKLEGGDTKTVEDLFFNDLQIASLKVKNSSYANSNVPQSLDEDKHYVQLNFDVTNKMNYEISLKTVYSEVCYYENFANQCTEILYVDENDTNIQEQNLKPGETKSFQVTSLVSNDAKDFYIILEKFADVDAPTTGFYIESEVANKS